MSLRNSTLFLLSCCTLGFLSLLFKKLSTKNLQSFLIIGLLKYVVLSSLNSLEILRDPKYVISSGSCFLSGKPEGFISADGQREALMLPNCDPFSFHLVCFIIAQEIYPCLESVVKGALLRLQRKTVINSKSKSELPVKHSFGPCVCMKHV